MLCQNNGFRAHEVAEQNRTSAFGAGQLPVNPKETNDCTTSLTMSCPASQRCPGLN
jgi:hypothetical protein